MQQYVTLIPTIAEAYACAGVEQRCGNFVLTPWPPVVTQTESSLLIILLVSIPCQLAVTFISRRVCILRCEFDCEHFLGARVSISSNLVWLIFDSKTKLNIPRQRKRSRQLQKLLESNTTKNQLARFIISSFLVHNHNQWWLTIQKNLILITVIQESQGRVIIDDLLLVLKLDVTNRLYGHYPIDISTTCIVGDRRPLDQQRNPTIIT